MDEAVDPLTGTIRDLRLDDRDLPLAPNFFTYTTQFSKANPPWARQMMVYSLLFGEICPHCTDKRFMRVDGLPPDYPTRDLPEHIQFMNHGVCPKCGGTKAQFLNDKLLQLYNELVLVWGQRCIEYGSVVLTENGLARIGDIIDDAPFGFSDYKLKVHNGEVMEETSQVYKSWTEHTYRATLTSGHYIVGTKDHPIKTINRGFVLLPDLVAADSIELKLGTGVFGKHCDIEVDYSSIDQVPSEILGGDLRNHTSVLAGLARCYGNTSIDAYQTGSDYYFTLPNEQLVLDLSAILLNIGVFHLIKGETIIVLADEAAQLINAINKPNPKPRSVVVSIEKVTKDKLQKTYDFTLPDTHQFIANGIVNHNSGKSTSGMKGVAYLIHRFLKFPKISSLAPTEILPSTPLTGTFISLTFSRAVSLLWVPLMNELNDTPWFDDYYSFLDDHGERYGVEFYRKKDLFLKFFHKNYHLYPSHPNAGILRGDTRILGAVDELGLFKPPRKVTNDDEGGSTERANAREAIESLTSSMATVGQVMSRLIRKVGMNHCPMTMMFGLSSPKSERDMVMERLRLALGEGKFFILGSHLPTWEVNPNLPRDCDFIKGKFTADPVAATRDFGAQPPKVSSTAIHKSLYTGKRYPFNGPKNVIKMEYEYDIKDKEVWGRLTNAIEGKWKFNTATILDAGYSDNSFAIAAVGIDPDTAKVTFPAILEIIPKDGFTVNFNRLYQNVILPFAKSTRSQMLVADRWNSLDLLHRARDDIKKIATLQHSLRRSDFDEFLQVLSNANIEFPFLDQAQALQLLDDGVDDYRLEMTNKPIEHLLWQLHTLQDMGPMAMPDKADGYTDDVLRTIILGTWTVLHPKYFGVISEGRVNYSEQRKSGVVGTYRSRM